MSTYSNLIRPTFVFGNDKYHLSPPEQKQHTWFVVQSKLVHEPEHNFRFYNDDELLDLLDLHPYRDGKKLMELAKIYSDLGNLAPIIHSISKSLALSDIDEKCVVIEDDAAKEIDTETATVRKWLSDLNEGGLAGMLDEVVDLGALYGTNYVALGWNPLNPTTVRGICKDAMAVFPITDPVTTFPYKILTHYFETQPGTTVAEEWVEVYTKGAVEVYRNGKLFDELSAETGIKSLTLVMAPYKTQGGSIFGKSALNGLVESLIRIAGVIGSAENTYRIQAGGIWCISSEDDVATALPQKGAGARKTVDATKTLDADSPLILSGKGMSISSAQGNVMSAANPLLDQAKEFLALKCPVYGWTRLGADASGEAIEQTYKMLIAEMNQIRRNLKTLIARMVTVLSELYKQPLKGKVNFYPPDVFPPNADKRIARALELKREGVVPIAFVAEEAGVDDNPLVSEFIDKTTEAENKQPAEQMPEETKAQAAAKIFGITE